MASKKPSRKSAGAREARLDPVRLERILDRFAKIELLVLGDVVLDEYLWGDVDRVSPEAPVPVVHLRDESTVLGGAGNVVRNVVALGGRCRFGPDLHWVDSLDYDVDAQEADNFYASIRRYYPALEDGALLPDYTGIRPKLYARGEAAPDFAVLGA